MSPRRDVEGEIYAQLYGDPLEGSDRGETRVIGDQSFEVEPPPGPGKRPHPPLSRFDARLAAAAGWLGGARAAIRSAGSRPGPTGRRGSARRGLAIGTLAAAVIAIGAVAGLSAGSDDRRPRALRIAAAPPATDPVAKVLASEAREDRRERAARRRLAARRRAAERAEARRANEAQAPEPQRQATLVCGEGQGCVPPDAVVEPERDGRGDDLSGGDESEQSAERDEDEPSARTDVDVDTSDADEAGDIDVDVDVDVD